MHTNDERLAVSNRPSLLSSTSLAEGSGNRILGNLEHNSGAKSGVSTFFRRSMMRGGVFGATIICVFVAVSWMWFSGARNPDYSPTLAPAVLVNPAVSPSVVAAISAEAIPAEAIPTAATIINDESVAVVAAKPTGQASSQSVSGALAAVLASPTAQTVVVKSAPVAARPKTVAARKKPPEERKEQAKPTPAPVEVDGDVTLFAALMAHLQGQPEDKGTALTKQLEKCRFLDPAQVEQCRVQACSGIAKTEKACQRTETTPAAKGTQRYDE